MHLPNATDPHDTEVWIQVKMVMMNKHHGVIFKQKHNFKTELLPDQGGWIEIDVRDMVAHWLKHSEENYGFTISVESAKGHPFNVSFQHQQQNGQVSINLNNFVRKKIIIRPHFFNEDFYLLIHFQKCHS